MIVKLENNLPKSDLPESEPFSPLPPPPPLPEMPKGEIPEMPKIEDLAPLTANEKAGVPDVALGEPETKAENAVVPEGAPKTEQPAENPSVAAENPGVALDNLFAEKKETESRLSTENLSAEDKAGLEKQRKEKSVEIIKKACEVLGRDFGAEQEAVKRAEEEQWRKSIEAAYGDQAKYEISERENATQEVLQRQMQDIMGKKLQKIPEAERAKYSNPDDFFEKARKDVFARTADNYGKNGIVLSKESFCGMLLSGFDPENIREAGVWEVIKHSFGRLAVAEVLISIGKEGDLMAIPFTDGRKKGSEVMTFSKLKDFIEKLGAEFKAQALKESQKEIAQSVEQKKEEMIDQSIEQVVLNAKINELEADVLAKQSQENQLARKAESSYESGEGAEEIRPEEAKKPEIAAHKKRRKKTGRKPAIKKRGRKRKVLELA